MDGCDATLDFASILVSKSFCPVKVKFNFKHLDIIIVVLTRLPLINVSFNLGQEVCIEPKLSEDLQALVSGVRKLQVKPSDCEAVCTSMKG